MKGWRIFFGSLFLVVSLFSVSAVQANTIYTVQYGDTLWSIARRFNLMPRDIAAVNPKIVDYDLIYGGDVLIIPSITQSVDPNQGAGGEGPYIIQPGDTLFRIALNNNTTIPEIRVLNPQIKDSHWIYAGDTLTLPGSSGEGGENEANEQNVVEQIPADGTYIVQPGDGLTGIARKFGTDVETLLDLNPDIENRHLIFINQVIKLPPGKGGEPENKPVSFTGLEVGGETQTLAHSQRMSEIGMRWVKYEVGWQVGKNPEDVRSLVQQGHTANFKVLLTIAGAGDYPTPNSLNYTEYVDFVSAVAGFGADAPDAIEVWHEQNIDLSWPVGEISAANYVRFMLAPTYSAIKRVNPSLMVISGGLSPTGMHNFHNVWADNYYIGEMAAAGATAYADCIGVHYNTGATSPNALSGHPGGSHYSWYFLPMISLYGDTFGQGWPLCFTQFGYLSPQSFPGVSGGFNWSESTKVDQQAAWLAEAVTLAQADNRPVQMMIIYNVDYTNYDVFGDPNAGYAIFRPNGSCPACDSLSLVIPRG